MRHSLRTQGLIAALVLLAYMLGAGSYIAGERARILDNVVALEHLQGAEAELPGWWLVQEHIAEIHNRRSEHGKAIAIYEELVRVLAARVHHALIPEAGTKPRIFYLT